MIGLNTTENIIRLIFVSMILNVNRFDKILRIKNTNRKMTIIITYTSILGIYSPNFKANVYCSLAASANFL